MNTPFTKQMSTGMICLLTPRVDWSGRAVIEGKRGRIPDNLPPILQRLKIDPSAYVKFINRSEKRHFGDFIGPVEAMRDLAERFGKSFLKGQTAAYQLFISDSTSATFSYRQFFHG